jgi:hypothetical protein
MELVAKKRKVHNLQFSAYYSWNETRSNQETPSSREKTTALTRRIGLGYHEKLVYGSTIKLCGTDSD